MRRHIFVVPLVGRGRSETFYFLMALYILGKSFCRCISSQKVAQDGPRCRQDVSKMASRRLPGASWGPLGRLLGPLGGFLGASWRHLGPSAGGPLTKAKIIEFKLPLRCDWEPSWGHLGAVLGPSRGPLGAFLGPSWGHPGAILRGSQRS